MYVENGPNPLTSVIRADKCGEEAADVTANPR